MSKYIETDHIGLFRESESHAVITNKPQALALYRSRRQNFERTTKKLESIDGLKEQIAHLTAIVQQLVETPKNADQHNTSD